jgi:hypothetical protein
VNKLEQAYQTFKTRQDRSEHPDGKFDRGGRWYPSEDEEQACCGRIRSPSRAYPYSLMTHCRTLRHVAKLYSVKESELRTYAKEHTERKAPHREGGDEYYKLVAKLDDRLVSIYDGATEYTIGKTLKETAHQGHRGGFYVYDSPEAARRAPFPNEAIFSPQASLGNDFALLKVRAEGNYCRYESKLAFSRVTPLEVVEVIAATDL